jgi:hypothetical protein
MKREPIDFHAVPAYSNLLDLLALWWRYERQQLPVQGYPVECPTTAGYRASRQYDDGNGAAETDERGSLALSVGRAVDGMEEPYRTALYIAARNRVTGASVWISPRLPTDKDERAQIVADALDMLSKLV